MPYIDFGYFGQLFDPIYSDKADFNTNAKSYYDALARNKEFLKQFTAKLIQLHNELEKDFEEHREFTQEKIDGFQNRLDGIKQEMIDFFAEWLADGTIADVINDVIFGELNQNINDRGVNVLHPPLPFKAVVGDGIADDTQALQELIDNFDLIYLPLNHTYRVTDTIYSRSGKKITTGKVSGNRNVKNAKILYDGVLDRKKAVLMLGSGNVGDEPSVAVSNTIVENFEVDGNQKAGFGVYGTYLTNETQVKGILAQNTLEYGMYFARGWYAKFEDLTARNNFGKGLAFGMPLNYQDGTMTNWSTTSPLELNNTSIRNIRSIDAGLHYALNNPGIFTVTDSRHRMQGYGIGLGIGNGFNCDTFTSERSGGVNLYVYTGPQPIKSIKHGYIENTMYKSGLPATEVTNMVIEHTHNTGDIYTIEDIFMNYNSGGIHHIGSTRNVLLKNVQQPRFLKSLDGLDNIALYAIVLKEHVYFEAGQWNTKPEWASNIHYEIDLKNNEFWKFQVPAFPKGIHLVYAKKESNIPQPDSYLKITELDTGNTIPERVFPTLTNEWSFVGTVNGNYNEFSLGGNPTIDTTYSLKIISQKSSL